MKNYITYAAAIAIGLMGFTQALAVDTGVSISSSTVYRLNDDATYTEGCFPPCLCPIWFSDDIRGTFVLTPRDQGGTFFTYDVGDVNWYVSQGAAEIRITGSGIYTRISGVAGWMHQLELDLSVNGGEVTHFDSGLVNGGGNFPDITGLTISMNDLYCYDIAIDVEASPVPPREVVCYRLGYPSTYQEGCWDPCDCPIIEPQPLRGSFALVELADHGTVIEYGVVNADWRVLSAFEPPSSRFDGFGRYTRISGVAGWIHRMELELSVDGEALTHFDSGLVNGSNAFPSIEILLSMNGLYCYDIALDIDARPCRLPVALPTR